MMEHKIIKNIKQLNNIKQLLRKWEFTNFNMIQDQSTICDKIV